MFGKPTSALLNIASENSWFQTPAGSAPCVVNGREESSLPSSSVSAHIPSSENPICPTVQIVPLAAPQYCSESNIVCINKMVATVIDPEYVLSQLSSEEKITLLSGDDMWHTVPVSRLGVPRVRVSCYSDL